MSSGSNGEPEKSRKQKELFMSSRITRRSLVGGASAIGTGAALSGRLGVLAQGTPEASPAASPVAIDPDFHAASDALIAELQGQTGKRLKILSAVVGGKTPEEDALFAQEITRLTNIEVELVHPTADYDEKLLADLAAGVEYDLIYTNKDTVETLVADEVLTDLTDRIAGSAILSNPTVIPPEEWEMLRLEDGRIYAVFQKFEGARMLTVRQDWLDQLGLTAPRTLDEVYNVMVAFRDQDPAGNGAGATLGLATSGTYDIQPFMSSQGILPGYVYVNGKRTIPYATEAAIPVYEWLAKLYAEGLYDPNFATATTADMRNLFLTDRVGFVTYWDTWVGLFNSTRQTEDPATTFDAKGIAACEGPDGRVILNRGQPSVWTIPVNAPDPDTAFKFTEWWQTFPGITLGSLGILDHDYTVSGDTYALTEVGKEHNMDHGQPTPYNSNWVNPIGELPGLKDAQEITKAHGYLAVAGPQWSPEVEPILNEFIIKAILGDVAPADAVTGMHEQLLSQDLIDE
jgi:putative aldouronate transport system substrate-binding protein